MKKNKFIARPFLCIFSTILLIISLPTVVFFTIEFIFKGFFIMLMLVVPFLFFALISFVGLVYSLRKIVIYDDKILEKNIFCKIINECIISEIIEVLEETNIRAPTLFVIKYEGNLKDIKRKYLGYIKFQKTKKSEKIMREIWNG